MLSIIIPVYNVMPTLMRCVDSIVLQPVDKMQLILVDDGSTDGSGAMCDNIKRQYENEDCEITVIHKDNGGLSSARNAGLAQAKGDLITFVDSDDFLGKNTYSKQMEFFDCSPDVDIVEFPVAKFYNNFLKKEMLTFTVDFYENPIDYLYETEAFRHAYAWNKIYRRRVFFDEQSQTDLPQAPAICYPEGKSFEDIALLPDILSRAHRIVTSDGGCYFYTFNEIGICQTSGAKQYADHLEALTNLINRLPDERRKGAAYAKLFAAMLNVRQDFHKNNKQTDASEHTKLQHIPRWTDILAGLKSGMRKPEILKLIKAKF
ncbi:MAG: glycosyltransferase family 2 protein [Bacteroidaceae bacterium]|nr:glycosyltransferase family 2 protein [Bacteroidaceae bacterium]